MKCAGLATACLTAGLVAAWPGETQGAPVPTGLGVQVTAGSQSIDRLWFFFMVGNSPLSVATLKTDLGPLNAGQTASTWVSVPYIDSYQDSWMVAGYYTDGLSQKHLVVSMSNAFATSITASPALSFEQTFNQAAGTRTSRNNGVQISQDGTEIGSIPDGTDVTWAEATVIDSLRGTDSLSYIYRSTSENMPYGEAFLGAINYGLYTTGDVWLQPQIGQAGKLVGFSDASVIGTAIVAVPEPASLALLGLSAGLLLARRNLKQ